MKLVLAGLLAFVLVVCLVVAAFMWSTIAPIAVLGAIVAVAVFAIGMYIGRTRARRSSERDW